MDNEGEEDGPEDEKEKRSYRAKRRRARMNLLFESLAADLGLPILTDRAIVLEKTRETLQLLRQELTTKKLRTMEVPALHKPLLSISDVAASHFRRSEQQSITYPPCFIGNDQI